MPLISPLMPVASTPRLHNIKSYLLFISLPLAEPLTPQHQANAAAEVPSVKTTHTNITVAILINYELLTVIYVHT